MGRARILNTGTVVAARPVGVFGEALLIVLLGAWAGIAVFVGPNFGYGPTTTSSWDWTLNNWLLHLLPGAVAVAAGLIILASTPGRRLAGTSTVVGLMSLLVIASGVWLVIGPDVWSLARGTAPLRLAATSNMGFLFRIGANLGPGVLLAALGGMAFRAGTAMPRVELLETSAPVADAAAAPAAGTAVPTTSAAAPTTAAPATAAPATAGPATTTSAVPERPAEATTASPASETPAVTGGIRRDPTVAEQAPVEEYRPPATGPTGPAPGSTV